jgi:hypothetical protein
MRPSVVHRGARWGAGLLLLLASCSTSPPAHPGRPLDVTIKDFKVLLSVDATRPGTVTFEVSNQGPTTHEFVVAQLDDSEGGGDRSSGYGYGSATLRGSAYGGVTSSSSGGYGYGSDADAGGHAAAGGPSDGTLLPIGGDGLSVDEDSVDVVDELEEVLDGDRDSLTVSLEPGTYVLFCNLEGHYLAGMYATIEVA